MATIKFRLNTTSSTVGPDRLDFIVEKSVSITEPFLNMAKVSVDTGADTVILGTGNVQSYVYLRNTDATNFVTIKNNADNTLSIIRAGEFALFPIAASAGLELLADTAACIVEYGHWAVA
jgi:hypothetical protein